MNCFLIAARDDAPALEEVERKHDCRWCTRGQMVSVTGLRPASAEARPQEVRILLPTAPTPFGTYVEALQTGNLLFLSGMLPVVNHKPEYVGRLGRELNIEDGRNAAHTAALGALAAARQALGSLDRITRVVRLGIFVTMSTTGRILCSSVSTWTTEPVGVAA